MFDDSIETFEMLKRPNTVQIIATQKDKILLAKEEQPGIKREYTLLGGRVDEGETPLACAKRELLEEAGVESTDWELIKTYEPYAKTEWTIYLYVARDCKKIAEQNLDPGEKIEIKKISFDKFIDIAVNTEKFSGKDIALDIARMKIKGTLEKFRQKLFSK